MSSCNISDDSSNEEEEGIIIKYKRFVAPKNKKRITKVIINDSEKKVNFLTKD